MPRVHSKFQTETDKTLAKVKVKGQGEGKLLQLFLWTGKQCARCATATCCTENKGLLTAQALPESKGELVQAAGF